MSDTAQPPIHAFTALPPDERHAVIVELARIADKDAGPVSDEELSLSGNEIFSMYDKEEGEPGETKVR